MYSYIYVHMYAQSYISYIALSCLCMYIIMLYRLLYFRNILISIIFHRQLKFQSNTGYCSKIIHICIYIIRINISVLWVES